MLGSGVLSARSHSVSARRSARGSALGMRVDSKRRRVPPARRLYSLVREIDELRGSYVGVVSEVLRQGHAENWGQERSAGFPGGILKDKW